MIYILDDLGCVFSKVNKLVDLNCPVTITRITRSQNEKSKVFLSLSWNIMKV